MFYKGFEIVITAKDIGDEEGDEVIEFNFSAYTKIGIGVVHEDGVWYKSFRDCIADAKDKVDSF